MVLRNRLLRGRGNNAPRPHMLAVFPVPLHVAQPGILRAVDGDDLAVDQGLKVFRKHRTSSTGKDDRVDIPVVGPQPIDFAGYRRCQLPENLLGQPLQVVLLAADLDAASIYCFVQPVSSTLTLHFSRSLPAMTPNARAIPVSVVRLPRSE